MEPKSPSTTPNQAPTPNPGATSVNPPSSDSVAENAPDTTSGQNVAPASMAANPDTAQNTPTPTPSSTLQPAAFSEQKSKAKPFYLQWQFYVIIVLAIAAIAGWIFGANGIQESQAAQAQVAGLENEITEKNQLLVKYGTELGYKVDQNGRPIETERPTDPEIETAVTDIYIAEWGLKFKIPEQLKNVSYMYSGVEYYTETINRSTDVCVTGMPAEATGEPGFADLRHIGWAGLGCLGRFPIKTEGEIVSEEWYQAQREAAVYEDEKYYYVFSGPQATFSGDPTELQWELQATQLVREMLTQNISTFDAK